MPDVWWQQPWPEPPDAGDEVSAILGALERQRATFEWKCGGLDAAGLRKPHPPSAITLGGLLKHMALVEDHHFAKLWFDREVGPPWSEVDWDANPDWEWESAAEDSPEELLAMWRDAVARSRAIVDEAVQNGGLEQLGQRRFPDGSRPNLRRILLDLIEEYGRHIGHADLIRESVDGVVGEDPPS